MSTVEHLWQRTGHTPLLRLDRWIDRPDAQVFGKLEYANPTGSVKDRAALRMVDDAQSRGLLGEGGTIIEPTSGNTGIALASIAADRGYRIILCMPETMSAERKAVLTGLGAQLELTPASEGMKGAIARAEELVATTEGAWMADQFNNPANPRAHFETTGPEIWADTFEEADILIAGVGTGGTLTGTGLYLKEQKPSVRVIAVEPVSSPVLSGGAPGSHKIQGIGAGFVPGVLDVALIDEVVTVADEDAFSEARALAQREGLLAGISSGAALAAARQLAGRSENAGKTIVVVLPDTGERYLSMGVIADMQG
jgi:cysteine synthase A